MCYAATKHYGTFLLSLREYIQKIFPNGFTCFCSIDLQVCYQTIASAGDSRAVCNQKSLLKNGPTVWAVHKRVGFWRGYRPEGAATVGTSVEFFSVVLTRRSPHHLDLQARVGIALWPPFAASIIFLSGSTVACFQWRRSAIRPLTPLVMYHSSLFAEQSVHSKFNVICRPRLFRVRVFDIVAGPCVAWVRYCCIVGMIILFCRKCIKLI